MRVPLARRNLLHDRRRAALAVGGVAVALLLVLVLDGIFAGAMRQVTAYLRASPADVFVSQRGVRTMHMSNSALPAGSRRAVRAVPGVAWVEPIGFATAVVRSGSARQLSYVIGYDVRSGRGGPGRLVAGRPPGRGEVVLDERAAQYLATGVGGEVSLFGRTLRVSGLSTGGTSIVNSTAFVSAEEDVRLRGGAPSYLLVGAAPGVDAGDLARAVEARVGGVTAQTRAEFARQERAIVADMSADVMRIMAGIGFAIALAVVGLTLFTGTLARLREFGVVKALGARSARLAAVVAGQAAWTVLLALASAVLLAAAVGAALERLAPAVEVAIEPDGVVRTGIGAALTGVLGAVAPLRRVARVDPASAFRRAT